MLKNKILLIFLITTLSVFSSDFKAGNQVNLKNISNSNTNIISGKQNALKKTQTTFTYNENSVYEITVSPTFATVLQLSPDEEVNDYILGDEDNFPIAETRGGKNNTTFVAVSAEDDDIETNLIIITNKRIYNLKLTSDFSEYNSFVKWSYPDTREMILFNEKSNRTMATSPEKINMQYYISNKKENFSPLNVYDDGEFTYFKMKKNFKEMPVVFMQESDGVYTEVPVDVNNIDNNIMKVRKVSKRIKLTIGKKNINILNQNYNK